MIEFAILTTLTLITLSMVITPYTLQIVAEVCNADAVSANGQCEARTCVVQRLQRWQSELPYDESSVFAADARLFQQHGVPLLVRV